MEKERFLLGKLDVNDSCEIEPIIERLAGIEELLIIAREDKLRKRLKEELEELKAKCDMWWEKMVAKYDWNRVDDSDWEIEFETGKIWIISK